MKLFRPKFEEIETGNLYRETGVADGVLTKEVTQSGESYEYVKTFTIGEIKYFLTFSSNPTTDNKKEFSLAFGLQDVDGNPITNAGLETFGKIVDQMASSYEEILKEESVDRILITASWDGYSKDDLGKIKETIAEDPNQLNGLEIVQEGYQAYSIKFENGVAIIKMKGKLGIPFTDRIPVTASLMDDIKHITKIDIKDHVPDMLNYINGSMVENKKQIQRLKLYQFYLHKRYPKFTFNSREVVNEQGKKELEFEKLEGDEPYLLVTTNN